MKCVDLHDTSMVTSLINKHMTQPNSQLIQANFCRNNFRCTSIYNNQVRGQRYYSKSNNDAHSYLKGNNIQSLDSHDYI